MTSETAKIRIKIGQLEIEYEGASTFLQDDLVRILERTIELQATHRDVIPSADAAPTPDPSGGAAHSDLQDSTDTIATHLGVKTPERKNTSCSFSSRPQLLRKQYFQYRSGFNDRCLCS